MTGLSQEANDERQHQRKRRLFAFCLQLVLFRFVTSENWFVVLEGQFPCLKSGEGAGLLLLREGFEDVCQGIYQTA